VGSLLSNIFITIKQWAPYSAQKTNRESLGAEDAIDNPVARERVQGRRIDLLADHLLATRLALRLDMFLIIPEALPVTPGTLRILATGGKHISRNWSTMRISRTGAAHK
jgi:hypothetical protein